MVVCFGLSGHCRQAGRTLWDWELGEQTHPHHHPPLPYSLRHVVEVHPQMQMGLTRTMLGMASRSSMILYPSSRQFPRFPRWLPIYSHANTPAAPTFTPPFCTSARRVGTSSN